MWTFSNTATATATETLAKYETDAAGCALGYKTPSERYVVIANVARDVPFVRLTLGLKGHTFWSSDTLELSAGEHREVLKLAPIHDGKSGLTALPTFLPIIQAVRSGKPLQIQQAKMQLDAFWPDLEKALAYLEQCMPRQLGSTR